MNDAQRRMAGFQAQPEGPTKKTRSEAGEKEV
jgi:hypothetical protein